MDIRLNRLAKILVNYSAAVKPGEYVVVEAEDAALPFIREVAKEVILAGGFVETHVNDPQLNEFFIKHADEKQMAFVNPIRKLISDLADVSLTAWGTNNTRTMTNVDPQRIKSRVKATSEIQMTFMQRMGSGALRWCGTQFPTHADAQEAGMSLSEYEDFVYGAGLLYFENPVAEWNRISAEQEKWVQYLDGKSELHVVSKGTDIRVGISGRKWINCDGHVNFPDGEIFTSPVDDAINGIITFSFPGIYMGREIEGICLDVKNGIVVNATAEKGEELLNALLKTDEGASRFGEVAIGTNYGIKQITRNMLFDEKMGGTVHMAIGAAMPDAGGVNVSAIHWDMLCDMRTGGTITADGELFYKDGKFLENVLK